MIRSVIIDDERRSRETLSTLLTQYCPAIEVITSADSVESGERVIRSERPDLLFLDIEMPYGTGFDLLRSLQGLRFEVIFTTAHSHYAIKAIKSGALDYLMKPIDRDDLVSAVERAQKKLSSQTEQEIANAPSSELNRIALPSFDGLVLVEISSIIRCEARGNYTAFHFEDRDQILVARTLKEFETMLGDLNFFRVHHGHLINLQHIRKYVRGEGGHVIMNDNTTVTVSRRRKVDLMKRLARS
ncbi:MAG: LytTR family DNA-binding domain-containing protein [Bacteroidota bacterium]